VTAACASAGWIVAERAPVAVLASGKGSNLAAILDAAERGRCPVDVRVVLSDKAGAGALAIARAHRVPVVRHLDPKRYPTREAFDLAMAEIIRESGCAWIVLAGFMRILSAAFVRMFRWRIVNVHPALLPAFPGAHAVRDALAYGVRITGVTVHLVDEGVDTGPILAQAPCEVRDDDDESSLHARLHAIEHRLYPETLRRIVERGFRLEGRIVRWR